MIVEAFLVVRPTSQEGWKVASDSSQSLERMTVIIGMIGICEMLRSCVLTRQGEGKSHNVIGT